MAVRIPQYNEQGSARGPMTSVNVPNIQASRDNAFSIAAEGLKQGAGLARELESRDKQAEAEARRLAAEAKHAEEQQAQVWVAQQLPAFHMARETDFQDQFKAAGPGAPGFSKSYADHFNKTAGDLRESAPNDTTKRMLDLHLSKSFEHYGMKAIGAERGEFERYQGETHAQGITDASRVVFSSPDQFDLLYGAQATAIQNNTGINEATRAKLKEGLRKDMANAAMEAFIMRDPGAALRSMQDALPGRKSITAKGPAGTYTVPFSIGTDEEQRRWMGRAEQEVGKIRQDAQVGLQAEIQNAQAMARDGVAPVNPPLPRQSFLNAYAKPELAERQYQQYITAYQTAGATARLANAPSADLIDVIKSQPNPKDKDYAIKSANLNVQQAAATRILQQRQADPVAYAMQTGDFGFTPIDPAKPEFVGELQKRAASLPVMAAKYGKAEILTKTESQVLARRLDVLPADQRVAELEKLRLGLTDDAVYGTVLQSIRPDSPVTALVGNIAAVGFKDNARYIAAGEDLLNPTKGDKGSDGRGKFAMPKEQLLQQAWVDKVGEAYRGFPEAERTAYQAFKAYYASQAAARGLNDPMAGPDDGIVAKALTASTGGVTKWRTDFWGSNTPSARVILPYGMPDDQFRDKVSAEWQRLRGDAGYTNTDVTDVGLQNTGANGEYMVMSGTSWMPGKDGKPIILRIK